MQKEIIRKLEELNELFKQLKLKSLYTFGSVNTDQYGIDSDIDILIAFQDDISIEDYTDNYFELLELLRKELGRNIDLVTEKSLKNPYLKESIEKSKRLIYAG